jgi:hypothetical protein
MCSTHPRSCIDVIYVFLGSAGEKTICEHQVSAFNWRAKRKININEIEHSSGRKVAQLKITIFQEKQFNYYIFLIRVFKIKEPELQILM